MSSSEPEAHIQEDQNSGSEAPYDLLQNKPRAKSRATAGTHEAEESIRWGWLPAKAITKG